MYRRGAGRAQGTAQYSVYKSQGAGRAQGTVQYSVYKSQDPKAD